MGNTTSTHRNINTPSFSFNPTSVAPSTFSRTSSSFSSTSFSAYQHNINTPSTHHQHTNTPTHQHNINTTSTQHQHNINTTSTHRNINTPSFSFNPTSVAPSLVQASPFQSPPSRQPTPVSKKRKVVVD